MQVRYLTAIGLVLLLFAGIAFSIDSAKTDTGLGPPTAAPPAMPAEPAAPGAREPSLFPPGGIPKLRSGTISRREGPSRWPRSGNGIGPETAVKPSASSGPANVQPSPILGVRLGTGFGPGIAGKGPIRPAASRPPRNWIDQTVEDASAKSVGCLECHKTTDALTMHVSPNVVLGCTDCHGGDPRRGLTLKQ